MDPQPAPRSSRFWLWVGVAFAGAWCVYLLVLGPRIPHDSATKRAGEMADFAWKLQDLDGQPVSLERFRGRAVFLNIWATWCPPCVKEMPSIARLASDPRLKDVAFVCVSVDRSLEPVRHFKTANNLPMTVLWSSEDVPSVFETDGIPATFIIAPDGHIALAEVGSSEWDKPAVIARLEALARSAPASPAVPGPLSAAAESGATADSSAAEAATPLAEPATTGAQVTPVEPKLSPPEKGRRFPLNN